MKSKTTKKEIEELRKLNKKYDKIEERIDENLEYSKARAKRAAKFSYNSPVTKREDFTGKDIKKLYKYDSKFVMKFGKHKGKQIFTLPKSYLEFLSHSCSDMDTSIQAQMHLDRRLGIS